jgi:hypothetical protein
MENTENPGARDEPPPLQSTGGEDVPKIFLCRNRNGHHNTKLQLLTCS